MLSTLQDLPDSLNSSQLHAVSNIVLYSKYFSTSGLGISWFEFICSSGLLCFCDEMHRKYIIDIVG